MTVKLQTLPLLMELHQQHEKDGAALPSSFCDGFFLSVCGINKRIRELALQRQFRFQILPSDQLKNKFYHTSIFTLEYQYRHNTVFYKDTLGPVQFLLDSFENIRDVDFRSLDVLTLQHRYILHETAHLLNFLNFFSPDSFRYDEESSHREAQLWLVKHLAIEAAILAVEFLSSLNNYDFEKNFKIDGANAPLTSFKDELVKFTAIKEEMGQRDLFRLLARGFLAANLVAKPSEAPKPLKTMIADGFNYESAGIVVERTLRLSEIFRILSNTRHFSYIGLTYSFQELALSIDPESAINSTGSDVFNFNEQTFLNQ